MTRLAKCNHCGVPKAFSEDVQWNSDGTITQVWNSDHRRFFYEADGLNMLFLNLKDLLGGSIDHIIVEAVRKTTYDYFMKLFSGIKGRAIRALPRRKTYEKIADMGWLFGIGHLEVVDVKRSDYAKLRGRNIYSVVSHEGDLVGIYNAVEEVPAKVKVDNEIRSVLFTITADNDTSQELSGRLERIVLPRKPGNVEFERCPECGLPLQLENCDWKVEKGVIADNSTGRNMSLIGPEGLDAVFRELEEELGEDIQRSIIEAQRRYITSAFTPEEVKPENLASALAFRGMGNLVRLVQNDQFLEAVVENADPPLMVVGLLEGIFELVTGRDAITEYARDDIGTLEVKIEPVKIKQTVG